MHELYANSIDIFIKQICQLINVIFNTVGYSDRKSEAIISPLFKKCSRTEVKNYRDISLLCCIGKIFTTPLNSRLVIWADWMKANWLTTSDRYIESILQKWHVDDTFIQN